MPQRAPNVVVFLTDQQRWDTVGCYGQPLDVTPNMDRMAAQGVRFEHAYTCQPLCGPARAAVHTGRYATETGCFRNGIALPLDEKTIAHWMSEAGYEVGYIGKWHLASTDGLSDERDASYHTSPIPPERRGGYKDYWIASDLLEFTSHGYGGHMFDGDMKKREFRGYRVDCHTALVLDYLRTRDGSRPFFLFISYLEPHHQNDRNCCEGPVGSKERFRDFVPPGDLAGAEGDWRENYPDYLGQVNSLDHNLGRIRDELDRLGLAGDTLILLTSDHGSHFRTRNSEYKRSCHDACIRVPMIACGPGFPDGELIGEMVSLIDLPPTVLAAAGIEKPGSMRGRPLQQLVAGTPPDWPQEIFLQISESHVGRAIRTNRWKYSVRAPDANGWTDPDSDQYTEDFLYDLEADPHERKNLVADPDYGDVRRELRRRLVARMLAAGDAAPEILPAPE